MSVFTPKLRRLIAARWKANSIAHASGEYFRGMRFFTFHTKKEKVLGIKDSTQRLLQSHSLFVKLWAGTCDYREDRGEAMNVQKTGLLISACRKEKGLTQKQLAGQLNISDRTVSKWERGSGFPDISLLEPLADALGISVAGLLQGERVPASDTDAEVRRAVAVVYREMKARAKRKLGRTIALLFLSVFVIGFFVLMLDYSGVLLQNVAMEVPVGVYVNGDLIEKSNVSIHGKMKIFGRRSFAGQFAVSYVERTCRDGVTAHVEWDDGGEGYETIGYFAYGGSWDCGVEHFLYSSEDMTRFALKLEDGTVIATDTTDVPLLMLDEYYPLAW